MIYSEKQQVMRLYLTKKIQILVVTASLAFSLYIHVKTVVIMGNINTNIKQTHAAMMERTTNTMNIR